MKTPNKKTHASHSLEPRNTSVVVTSMLTGSTSTMPKILKKSHNELPPSHYQGVISGAGSNSNANPNNNVTAGGAGITQIPMMSSEGFTSLNQRT